MSAAYRHGGKGAPARLAVAISSVFLGISLSSAQQVEEQVVLGTNIEGMQVSNPSPVQVIGSEALFENPSASLMDYFVEDLTANNSGSVAVQEGFGGGNVEGSRNAAVDLRGLGAENSLTLVNGMRTVEDLTANNSGTVAVQEGFGGASVEGSRNAAADLRGLGAESSLTLVNGMRTVEYAVPDSDGWRSVDINATMPSIAFKRAEIMLDGGGALYGTDAISGVVNVVPNYGFEGVKIQAKRLGFMEDVGYGSNHLGVLVGTGNESTSLIAAIEVNDQEWVTSADLGTWENDLFLTRGEDDENRASLSARNYIAYERHTEGQSRPPRSSNWDLADPLCEREDLLGPVQLGADESVTGAPIYAGNRSSNTCQYYSGLSPVGGGQTDKESLTAMVGLEHAFSDRLSVEFNASYSEKEIVDHRFWSGTATSFDPFGAGPGGTSVLIPLDHPAVQYYVDEFGWNVGEQGLLANGLNGVSYMNYYEGNHEDDQYRFSGVLSYELTDTLNLKVGAVHGVSNVHAHIRDFIPSRMQEALNGNAPGGEYFNPFMSALLPNAAEEGLANSRSITDYIFPQDDRDWKGTLNAYNAILSGTLPLDLGAGDVGFAFGLETRDDRLEVDYDSFLNQGVYFSQSGVGLDDFDESTRVDSIMAEVVVPLMDTLTLQIAGRYDDYDIGFTSTNPKIGLNWQMTDDWTWRASWGTSFKAPTVYQTSVFADAPGWITTAYPDQNADQPELGCSLAPTAQEIANGCRPRVPVGSGGPSRIDYTEIFAGNPDLDPQESTNWSVGFDWFITDDLSLNLSYVSIEFDNLIDIPAGRDIVQLPGCTTAPGYFELDDILYYSFAKDGTRCFEIDEDGLPTAAYIQPRNLSKREVEAIDFTLRYSIDTDWGTFSIRPNGTIFLTWDEQNEPGGPISDVNGKAPTQGFGNAIEQYRVILPISWRMGKHSVTYTARGQSGIEDTQFPEDTTYWTGTSSFTYTYNYSDALRLSANFSNLFESDLGLFGLTGEYTWGQ